MRLAPLPEGLLERLMLKVGAVPTPLLDTFVALGLARTLMVATRAGVFEALAPGSITSEEVARACGTDPRATGKLLVALAGFRYLRARGGRYSLAPVARKWLLRDSPRSMKDAVLHRYLDLALLEHAEEFLRSGRPAAYHEPGRLSPELWDFYERGQRAGALYAASEVARRAPVPHDPRELLDVGGGHGHYSVALCRRHRNLRSTILDLPEAVEHSRPILEEEEMGERIRYRAGNALHDDLGQEVYDLVFMANLVHHFDGAENRALMKRIARALRPGGTCVVFEIMGAPSADRAGQIDGLLDFYFALTSAAGVWPFQEIASWQREAGLVARAPIRLRWASGFGMQAARRNP